MSLDPKAHKRGKSKYWIQEAVGGHEGALRDYVRNKYGSDGFTEGDTIKVSILHELIRDPDVTLTTKRRAQLALNLREIRANKGKR